MAKRKESLIQTFYETSAVACFPSMQMFHGWEKCRLSDLKNSFYLLIFSAQIKQSAQSHLTSFEIKGDLEGYFCSRRG